MFNSLSTLSKVASLEKQTGETSVLRYEFQMPKREHCNKMFTYNKT